MDKRKIITAVVVIILAIAGIIFGITYTDEDVNQIVDGVETITNIVEENISTSTTEIPDLTEEDEQILEVQETNLENEAFERQGEVAYNGSSSLPTVELGEYEGLTYYSQVDSRWANYMYSAINDSSQTIGTSGCGPTAAAMIVSSIRGTITPPEMGDLFVKYGYRSTNSGTYFSAMKWVADVFDIDYQETTSLNTAINLLENNYYIIVSCNEGLFTYGGHFIVIVGIDGDTLKIYDPYLYAGKFTTSSRKAANVTVDGNTVYVSVSNFEKYANYTKFYCYYNDNNDGKVNSNSGTTSTSSSSSVTSVNYKVKVTTTKGLNARSGAGTNYSIKTAYTYGTTLTIVAESKNWGKTSAGYWVCLDYTSKVSSSSSTTTSTAKYTTGTYQVTASLLHVRTGPGTSYSKKTYSQLTTNARSQNKRYGNYYANGLLKNVTVTVSQVSGSWGKIPSGWICLDYCKKL